MSRNPNTIAQRPRFSVAITTPQYQKLINSTLTDPARAARFIAAITSAVAVNPALQACDPSTIIAGALLGESLNLSPSPQLGQYYLVPFKNSKKSKELGYDVSDAQFVLGYKGYHQLALRSGYFKSLDAMEIKQGEPAIADRIKGKFEFSIINDAQKRETAPTVGYYAYYELLNGFRRELYWNYETMLAHADKYSTAFSARAYLKLQNGEIPDGELWKYSSFWYKNFDQMAIKTMYRQLLSMAPLSSELQTAQIKDQSVSLITDDGEIFTQPEEITISEEETVEEIAESSQVDIDDL